MPLCRFLKGKEAVSEATGEDCQSARRAIHGRKDAHHSISWSSQDPPRQNPTSSLAPVVVIEVAFSESLDCRVIRLASALRRLGKLTRRIGVKAEEFCA